ncbi:MAG: cardiolipin synthase [Clostridia bacterium]|nr:cardiolipin synthase [Clostridia bacterium]
MKRKYSYQVDNKVVEREYNYIPVRYIIAIMLTVLEVAAIIGIVVAMCWYVPYFYLAAWLTEIACVVKIIASDDNPDYKVPWLLFVLIIPVAGFMLYFLFYSRTLQKKYIRRMKDLKDGAYTRDDGPAFAQLREENPLVHAQARMLCKISESHLFTGTRQTYFPLGEDMHAAMLDDLRAAEKFIFMEYFIIEEGKFWNSILDILKEKAAKGVDVRVLYDDIGCMSTLPGNYARTLRAFGIQAAPFSRMRGNADSEFNNRSHRKILVVDGKIGYTGGVNIADEYINETVRFGHWKDTAIRLEGEAVWELTRLFMIDFGLNFRKLPEYKMDCFPEVKTQAEGYVIPFGDGPNPIYKRRVGKSVIQNMLAGATNYAWMTSPYLIIDNDLCQSIENAALRGVDVRIIVPHIPDKKLVLEMTRSFYPRLMDAGVKIYEYEPGFIHAKSYLVDGEVAMIGTINLDYRSLVHHFENGVWMYRTSSIADLRADIEATLEKCIRITGEDMQTSLPKRILRSVVRIFAPML